MQLSEKTFSKISTIMSSEENTENIICRHHQQYFLPAQKFTQKHEKLFKINQREEGLTS